MRFIFYITRMFTEISSISSMATTIKTVYMCAESESVNGTLELFLHNIPPIPEQKFLERYDATNTVLIHIEQLILDDNICDTLRLKGVKRIGLGSGYVTARKKENVDLFIFDNQMPLCIRLCAENVETVEWYAPIYDKCTFHVSWDHYDKWIVNHLEKRTFGNSTLVVFNSNFCLDLIKADLSIQPNIHCKNSVFVNGTSIHWYHHLGTPECEILDKHLRMGRTKRQRDIPGLERELIEMGLEYLI